MTGQFSEAFTISHSSPCVVPCFPNHINEADGALLQEENIDNLCNMAFDKLFIQEFNPDANNLDDDCQSEVDHPKEASKILLTSFSYIFFFELR